MPPREAARLAAAARSSADTATFAHRLGAVDCDVPAFSRVLHSVSWPCNPRGGRGTIACCPHNGLTLPPGCARQLTTLDSLTRVAPQKGLKNETTLGLLLTGYQTVHLKGQELLYLGPVQWAHHGMGLCSFTVGGWLLRPDGELHML